MGVPVPAKPVGLLGKEADLGELGHHGVHPDEARPGQLLGAALAVEGLALGALEEGLLRRRAGRLGGASGASLRSRNPRATTAESRGSGAPEGRRVGALSPRAASRTALAFLRLARYTSSSSGRRLAFRVGAERTARLPRTSAASRSRRESLP